MKLTLLPRNPLIPHSHRILGTLVRLEFANHSQENDIGIPVEEVGDVGLHVKLEGGSVLVQVLVVLEEVKLPDFERVVCDFVRVVQARQVVQRTHRYHPEHHVVEDHIEAC